MTSHELVQELRKGSIQGHTLTANYWHFSDSDAVNLINARDAAIRAECADRAVAWCKRWATFPMGNHGLGALRAAIEGGQ